MVASLGLEDREKACIHKAWRVACTQISTHDRDTLKKQAVELLKAFPMLPSELRKAILAIVRSIRPNS